MAAEGGAGAAAHLAEAMQWSRRRAYFCVAGHSPLEDVSWIGSAGEREGEPGGPGLTSLANSGEESGGSSDWCTGRAAPRRRPTSPASYLAPRLTEDGGGVMVRGVACRLHYNADEAAEEPEVAGAMGDSAPPRCAGEGAEYVEELLASHGTLIETIAAHGGSGEVGGGGGGGGGEGDGSGGFRSPTEFGTAEGSSGRRGRGADLGGRYASNELRLCHRLGLPPRTPALAMREDSASAILRNWWLSLMPLLEVVRPANPMPRLPALARAAPSSPPRCYRGWLPASSSRAIPHESRRQCTTNHHAALVLEAMAQRRGRHSTPWAAHGRAPRHSRRLASSPSLPSGRRLAWRPMATIAPPSLCRAPGPRPASPRAAQPEGGPRGHAALHPLALVARLRRCSRFARSGQAGR